MKTLTRIERIILIVVLGVLLMGAGAKGTRYVSGWRLVPGGGAVRFEHGLGVRPLEVDVWVAHYAGLGEETGAACQADFTMVMPAYASEGLEVQAVSDEAVSVLNVRDVPVCVQVVAEK